MHEAGVLMLAAAAELLCAVGGGAGSSHHAVCLQHPKPNRISGQKQGAPHPRGQHKLLKNTEMGAASAQSNVQVLTPSAGASATHHQGFSSES